MDQSQWCLIITEGVTVRSIPFSALRDVCVQNQEEWKVQLSVGSLDLLWLCARRTDNLGHKHKISVTT